MILYSVVLKCLDPILTIACSLSFKDPFVMPLDPVKRAQAMESRRKFSAGLKAFARKNSLSLLSFSKFIYPGLRF